MKQRERTREVHIFLKLSIDVDFRKKKIGAALAYIIFSTYSLPA